ncbi:MAG: hypothetical protein OXE86_15865 [Alphaproteobacteria bacterium]|nr:hypothetical protein [Alphaproteobacteria bacterium]
MTAPEFSRVMHLADLLSGSGRICLQASGRECAALARRFGVESISDFRVTLRTRRLHEGAIRLEGTACAEVAVAGEAGEPPLDFIIGEEFEETVATPEAIEILGEIDSEQAEDAEPAPGGVFDVGEVCAQQLSLALDPVMLEAGRFESGTLACSAGDGDLDGDSPFSALRTLDLHGSSDR